MFMQLGAACLAIWAMNWYFMLREFLQHTPNWREDEVDSDEIIQNFLANTPLERLMFIQKLAQMNPLFLMSGAVMLLFGLLI